MIEDRQPILVAFYIGPGNGAGLFFQPGAHKDSGGSGVFILGGHWDGDTFIWGHTTNTFALNYRVIIAYIKL